MMSVEEMRAKGQEFMDVSESGTMSFEKNLSLHLRSTIWFSAAEICERLEEK